MDAPLLVNLFTGILFRVDDAGVYRRGPFFILQYLLSYIYVFAACGHALLGSFRRENLSRRRLLRSLALFPIAPAGAGIVQFVYPQLPVACIALSFATLILYHNWLDSMISIDPLTRLNNRKQLVFHYEQWQQRRDSPAPLYLVMIDADKFKAINDTYGHIQGDAALGLIADVLRLACSGLPYRANIARYGGDEFAILAMVNSREDLEALCERITRYLSELGRDFPGELSVSTGFARAEKGKPLDALVGEADAELYKVKKNKR